MYAAHFDFSQPLILSVPALYSPAECAELLAGAADHAWLPATVNSAEGRVIDARIRDNTVAVLRDPGLAEALFRRVKPHVPARMQADVTPGVRGEVALVGVHDPLRIYRYEPGQHFGLHHDQSYQGAAGARSLLTLMVYLNDDFDGGVTDFPELKRTIVPRVGDALWFQHMVLHAGTRVTRGTKYVLRSDVLYRP